MVETYSALFENLSAVGKLKLLERLTKSIKKGRRFNEKDFFSSFAGFASEKPAEEINKDIRES